MDGKELRFLDDPHICSMPKRQNPFDIKMNPLKKLLLRLIVVSKKHPEHWKYLECENDITFEQRRQIYSKTWFVMHPFSILAGLCDTAMLIVYLLDQYNVPFLSTEKTSFSELKYFTAPLMVLNVARQFVTGYMDKEFMVAVLDLKKIFWHYFSGFFFLDLVGAVPLNTTIIFLCKLSGYHLNEHIRYYLGTLRLTVVFTLRLLHQCLMLSLEYFNANATIKRILPLVLYTGVFLNWSARMLVFVPKCVHGPDLPNVNGSWLNIRVHEGKEKPLDEPEEKLLVLCFFRTSMLLLKLGFGSVYPRTGEDVFLSVLLVIAGRMMFFYLIEQVLSLNRWMWSPRVRYHVQMKLVKGFLRHRDVPLVTQRKVQMYFERQLGGTYFREGTLLSLLSASLREELRDHELRILIRDSQLLRIMPPGLAVRMARCLKREIFLPNDVVMRVGTFGDCMYLISSGTLCVVLRNGFEVAHKTDGMYFGETEIITSTDRRMTSVIAIEVCELYRLDRDEALRYLRMDPKTMITLKEKSDSFMAASYAEVLIQSMRHFDLSK